MLCSIGCRDLETRTLVAGDLVVDARWQGRVLEVRRFEE